MAFITLTDAYSGKPIHIRAASIVSVHVGGQVPRGKDFADTTALDLGAGTRNVLESVDTVLGMIGSRGEPRAADRHLLTLAADMIGQLVHAAAHNPAVPHERVEGLLEDLRTAAEYWRAA